MLHDMSKRLSPKQHESVIGPAGTSSSSTKALFKFCRTYR